VSSWASTGVGGVIKVEGVLSTFGGVAGDVITVGGGGARFGDGVFSPGSSTNTFVNSFEGVDGSGGTGGILFSLLPLRALDEKSLPNPLSPLRCSPLVFGRSALLSTVAVVVLRFTGLKASLSVPPGEGLRRACVFASNWSVEAGKVVAWMGTPGEVCGRDTVWLGIKGDEVVRKPTWEGWGEKDGLVGSFGELWIKLLEINNASIAAGPCVRDLRADLGEEELQKIKYCTKSDLMQVQEFPEEIGGAIQEGEGEYANGSGRKGVGDWGRQRWISALPTTTSVGKAAT
jgi:hypothetical protein